MAPTSETGRSRSPEQTAALAALAEAIGELRLDLATPAALAAMAAGASRTRCIEEGVTPGLAEVGKRFEGGVYFVPQLVFASDVAKDVLAALSGVGVPPSSLAAGDSAVRASGASTLARPTVVLGTVAGDVHDIGKTLVGEFLSAAGYPVIDLGVDQPAERFVHAARQHGAGLVGLSAMMTTAFPAMERTVASLKAELPGVPVVVGGAPLTAAIAEKIGADGYGRLATDALRLVGRLAS